MVIGENQTKNEDKFVKIDEDITAWKINIHNHSAQNIDEELKNLSLQLKRKVNENTHQNKIESLSTEYNVLKEQCCGIEKQFENIEENIL